MKSVLLAIAAIAGSCAANAQYTNYFSNQVFSSTTTSSGTFNGNTYSVASGGATITTYVTSPGGLPVNTGYPATGPTTLELANNSTSKTTTLTFGTTITPADHIYIDDFDNGENAVLTFRDSLNNVINPTGFGINKISSTFHAGFTATTSSSAITLYGGSAATNNPLLDIIPNARVKTIEIAFVTTGGTFCVYFGRNIPVLTHSLSTTSISRGHSTTLSYTLSGINNNPVYNLGFTNNLPSGMKVAAVPATTGSQGTFTAAANGTAVTLSAMNTAFSATTPVTSATWSVQISNADGQMNSSCGSNPAAFTNRSTNYVTSGAELSNSVTPVCLMVVAPLPVELRSFAAVSEGCDAQLRWETASESNLAGYDIERSLNGQDWTRIGHVAPGNKGLQQYSFRDIQVPQGTLQYRLRIQDMGGASEFSAVATVRSACSAQGSSFSVSPNPARTAFSCSFASVPPAGAAVVVYLSDLSGRLVATLPASSRNGATAGFRVPQLPAGLYILQATVDGVPAGAGKLVLQ